MVAYSFKGQFEQPIVDGTKRQTVRGYRKRHARPGEAVQLYVGMRTRDCRKILTSDPVCLELQHISIALGVNQPLWIDIDGRSLHRDEIEEFAVADGFGGELPDGLGAQRMAEFWMKNHGTSSFGGVVIRWEPR